MDNLTIDQLVDAIELLKRMHSYVYNTSIKYEDSVGYCGAIGVQEFLITVKAELKELRNQLCILRGE